MAPWDISGVFGAQEAQQTLVGEGLGPHARLHRVYPMYPSLKTSNVQSTILLSDCLVVQVVSSSLMVVLNAHIMCGCFDLFWTVLI